MGEADKTSGWWLEAGSSKDDTSSIVLCYCLIYTHPSDM